MKKLFQKLILVVFLIAFFIPTSSALAQDWTDIGQQAGQKAKRSAEEALEDFYQANDILFYSPNAAETCAIKPGTTTGHGINRTGNGANGNMDYKGRQIIKDEQLAKIKGNQPIYEEVAAEHKIPWQILAVIHIRESNLADFNPENGQGIYQDSLKKGNANTDYTYNGGSPVSDEQFKHQTDWAAEFLVGKAGSQHSLVEKGDPAAIKELFFQYNGAADAYFAQAKKLFGEGTPGYEGSPYVMNIADEKRDPEVNGDNWGQYAADYDTGLTYPARGDYGAFVMYAALAGIPSTGGSSSSAECAGSSLGSRASAMGWDVKGENAMAVYYQDEEPWASKPYGITIQLCGCGPTSVAMAIASLNNDSSITPEVMSNFFAENGYLNGGCGTRFDSANVAEAPFGLVEKKYGVEFIELGTDLNKAAEAVKRGSFVFLSSNGGNGFGGPEGHIMLIRGVTDEGWFLVADPNKEWGTGYDIRTSTALGEELMISMSNKTTNEIGFPPSVIQQNLQLMYEIRKA